VGKAGAVTSLLASIPSLPPAERPVVGKGANALKREVLEAIEGRAAELEAQALEAARSGAGFDATLPPAPARRGSLHPVTRVRREVEDIFTSMGYQILDGPEVELDYYNFQALNIPPDHPSREIQDTFYCDRDGHLVMRTQTSPVQIRAMERLTPPFRVIAPGRVFRNEQQDATHDHTFHQVEGLAVGEDISVGHLVGTLKGFLRRLLRRGDVTDVRLRPGHFPFVEPGFELDLACPFCTDGCRICKHTRWIEFCGCGMVHPSVLRAGGVDPERWSGFAFGFGLDRLVMMSYGIDDIRHLMGGDLRFLEQF
jgi:phenylalanyl-tRNA synthetase alpha chain